jgi:hypothetical protein
MDSVPCLITLVNLMVEKGIHVDVFCLSDRMCKAPAFDNESVDVYLMEPNAPKRVGIWKSRILFRSYCVAAFVRFVLRKSQNRKYDLCFGVETDGLISAFVVRFFREGVLIYFSLEVQVRDKLGNGLLGRFFKFLEVRINKIADATIIQDEGRREMLASENRIKSARIYLLPNAPQGRARHKKGFFLYHQFHIEESKILLLHAGSIGDWAYTKELARAAEQLSERYVTFFQSRYDLRGDDFVEGLREGINREKVIFSLEPLPYNRLDDLYRSADIGLAFYNTELLGANCQEIGLSSGKIAYYLLHGVPVIVNRETTLAKLVSDCGCGVVINDFGELEGACNEIIKEYERYSDCACSCFDRLLAVDKYFEKLYDGILARKMGL